METQKFCPNCRKPLPDGVPLGLCPECLIKSGFPTGSDPAAPAGPPFVPPKVEELARLFPQLEILALIGQGGMGAVYKARQPALDRFVALKILPPTMSSDPGFAERFNREARALARLNHPNIVAVYDFGQAGGLHFLLMEFIDGANLRQVEQAGKIPPEQALAIVPQICEALQFAHNEGIVHRDIKPENLLLDKKGRVKITDFGIAKILGVAPGRTILTGARDVVGTPHYMAPEQVEKPQEVDHRADIYSLGVVFYEMLTGELPLGKFAPPSKKVQVDIRFDEVVLHSLEKEPERRYQHASQVKTDVENIATTASASAQGIAGAASPVPPVAAASSRPATSDRIILPAFLLASLFGIFGAHRLYAGKILTGFLQLAGLGGCVLLVIGCATLDWQPILGILLACFICGCGAWAVIDWILIVCGVFTDGQGRRINRWFRADAAAAPSAAPAGQAGKLWILAGVLMVLFAFVTVAGLAHFVTNQFRASAGDSWSDSASAETPTPPDVAAPGNNSGPASNIDAGADQAQIVAATSDVSTAHAPEAPVSQARPANHDQASDSLAVGPVASMPQVFEGRDEAHFFKSLKVSAGGKLTMQVDRGGVEISGADQSSVDVQVDREVTRASDAEAAKILKEQHLVLKQEGNQISLTTQEPGSLRFHSLWGWWNQPNLEVHYKITVPRRFEVQSETAGGDVKVAGIQGATDIKTMGGRLEGDDIDGNLQGRTMGGDVRVAGCTGHLQLETMGGSIHIDRFTGSGMQARTEGGSVSANFATAPKADCELHTSGGNVTARIPGNAAVTVDAHTMGGSVRTDLAVQVEGRVHDSSLQGTINGGGPLLKLETMGGNIELLRQ